MPPLPVKSSGVLMERGAQGARACTRSRRRWRSTRSPTTAGPPCQHCGFCLFFMCEFRAKSTSMATMLPLAEATGRCEIRPGSYVARVEIGHRRAARPASSYFDAQKRLQLQRAKAVVLCANGAETPRLLLNSATSRFPNGLANSSGVVGKHLMFNTYFGVNAQFEHPLNEYKSVQNTRMVLDFYDTDPKRGHSTAAAASTRGSEAIRSPSRSAACRRDRRPGAKASPAALAQQYTRSMFFGCHGTSLPLETNSVTLDPALKDAWGLPCMRVTYKDHPDDLKNAEFLVGKALRDRAGGRRAQGVAASRSTPQTQSVHLLGTCRMGNDPQTSVIDKYHRTHDVKNLFICDGSSMVTSSRGPADDDDLGAGVPRRRAHRRRSPSEARSDHSFTRRLNQRVNRNIAPPVTIEEVVGWGAGCIRRGGWRGPRGLSPALRLPRLVGASRGRAQLLLLARHLLARILAVRRGVLDLRVHLRPDQDRQARHVEPQHQHDRAAEGAVGRVVVARSSRRRT